MIVILTVSDDIHALEIQRACVGLGFQDVFIVEVDRTATASPFALRVDNRHNAKAGGYLTSNRGQKINFSDISAIWLRRPRSNQIDVVHDDTKQREFIQNECKGGWASVLSAASFSGRWVSNPEATFRACDKIFQLRCAAQTGFRVPMTLVSQNKDEVIEFYHECGGDIIVKPLVGLNGAFLATTHVRDPRLIPEGAYAACPAIYQELIKGSRHIRLNSFGEVQVAALIETSDLDWRPNLNVPISRWELTSDLAALTSKVLARLDLRMGIIDIKITDEGEPVWLEVNPQGQFLFLEPFLEMNLPKIMARFLIEEARLVAS